MLLKELSDWGQELPIRQTTGLLLLSSLGFPQGQPEATQQHPVIFISPSKQGCRPSQDKEQMQMSSMTLNEGNFIISFKTSPKTQRKKKKKTFLKHKDETSLPFIWLVIHERKKTQHYPKVPKSFPGQRICLSSGFHGQTLKPITV